LDHPNLASPKVQPYHLLRQAIVYVRQSSPQQVIEHRESSTRQYALVDRAVALGWPRDRVLVIDEDQGRSGATVEDGWASNGSSPRSDSTTSV
jgi:hypothetical protein